MCQCKFFYTLFLVTYLGLTIYFKLIHFHIESERYSLCKTLFIFPPPCYIRTSQVSVTTAAETTPSFTESVGMKWLQWLKRRHQLELRTPPGRKNPSPSLTVRPCSHSASPSAVESGIWQRRLSRSSLSISSSAALRSSSRWSTRKPPRKGDVGDWQSNNPLE